MYAAIFVKLTGLTGLVLILFAYYLFWVSPDMEINMVISRTRAAILFSILGNIMVMFYLFKRQS